MNATGSVLLSCTVQCIAQERVLRLQIKDEQGSFKEDNFAELRHVGFGIKDEEGNVDGQPTRVPPTSRSCTYAQQSCICFL